MKHEMETLKVFVIVIDMPGVSKGCGRSEHAFFISLASDDIVKTSPHFISTRNVHVYLQQIKSSSHGEIYLTDTNTTNVSERAAQAMRAVTYMPSAEVYLDVLLRLVTNHNDNTIHFRYMCFRT